MCNEEIFKAQRKEADESFAGWLLDEVHDDGESEWEKDGGLDKRELTVVPGCLETLDRSKDKWFDSKPGVVTTQNRLC